MAKLINVIKDGDGELEKRQLPLVIDEKLTMVLDLIDVDFMCEYPKIRGKDKELFLRKFSMLSVPELKEAFQVSCKRLLDIVSEIVPCVGCRRSVERLFHQMKTGPGRSGLYPLVVTPEGVLILPEEVYKWPNVIGAMFHNHTAKLNSLSTSWSRSKKSSRCALHSLDAQRYVRPPLGSGWRALWECMVPFCKQEVATIDTSQLLSTLETYLQKHRFCTECRTKVMKAYSLLVDEPEERKNENGDVHASSTSCEKNGNPSSTGESSGNTEPVKEKGFIPSLYAGIRRCSPNNHIHVDQRTDYIMGLILAAEPELLGNRRERHAKTLEIAQEEVLVCVGLCLYERVHRIQLRLREEQTTCQLLALVAINALSTNFQLAVEMKQGISQLELLFQEFSREDRLKQKRKQVKKLKKRRKKQRKNAAAALNALQDMNTQFSNDEEEKQNSDEEENVNEDDDDEDECSAKEEKSNDSDDEKICNMKSYYQISNERIMKIVRNDAPSKYSEKKDDSCYCSKYEGVNNSKNKENHRVKSPSNAETRTRYSDKGKKSTASYESSRDGTTTAGKNAKRQQQEGKEAKSRTVSRPINEFSDTISNSSGSSSSIYSKYHSDKETASNNFISFNKTSSNTSDISSLNSAANDAAAACNCCSSIQMDCGYGSADNNNMSSNGSGESSVDSSEVACSEGFCNHEGTEECNFELRDGGSGDHGLKRNSSSYDHNKNSILLLDSASQSLQQMLTETSVERELNNDHRIGDCIIPVEEIQRYKSSMSRINEKRKQLRQTLKSRFAQLCLKQQRDVLPAL